MGVRFPLAAPLYISYFTCPDFLKFATLSHIRMKGFKIIFAVCLALLGFGDVWATESDDAVRAATRRGETNTITSARKKTNTPDTSAGANALTRVTNATTKQTQNSRERATTPRANATVSTTSRTSVTPTTKQVSARTATNTASRATTGRTATTPTVSRAAMPSRAAIRTQNANRNTPLSSRNAIRRTSVARSATDATNTTGNLRDAIMNSNARECRTVYYNCMDEFCANKDSQLKRCACSSRLHEFDSVKKQLENAEEKMLDFSQRLLTVSMDAEDAAALNVATEGELAFNQKDTSESKKLLDEITKKLNTKFDDDSFDRNLTAISLSLNEDAAFDNVDSLMGASTTLKTGTALYGAALPVCREMAAEVCTPEQLSIAESGYQMMIEQDCNTVKKSYQTQTDNARAKILENSALLDMSRLDTYQDKNSDDILTCKRKMLDMLSNTTVCGENLTKCLDMTGQYIDPSTGEAFLTENLANLSRLITRPNGDKTWTNMPGNEVFVQHLQSKKKFLEPAMEHCQDISDVVWNDFIEDALAQIKLAQDAKLEQVRQSCTTLTAQCLSDTAKSLTDFDARALSTFGVLADKTVNEMCADVKNACTALMETTGDGQTDWAGGMTEIATDTTYDTIIKTCREVGRACIIQACKSISGNFGLCENIETSVNRKAIINGTSCWGEVLDCVASAGTDSIEKITEQLAKRKIIPEEPDTTPSYSFYSQLYDGKYSGKEYPALASSITGSGYEPSQCMMSNTTTISESDNGPVITKSDMMRCVYDICVAKGECDDGGDTSTKCKTCRIAERIWGHCELNPITLLTDVAAHNMIIKPTNDDETTLLYWFALNTGTDTISDSCRDTSCGPGYRPGENGVCYAYSDFANDGLQCKTKFRIQTPNTETNCCIGNNAKDYWGNCCNAATGTLATLTYDKEVGYYPDGPNNATTVNVCIPNDSTIEYVLTFKPDDTTTYYADDINMLICLGEMEDEQTGDTTDNFPSGDTLTCSGRYLVITNSGMYYSPENTDASPTLSYLTKDGNTRCELQYDGGNQTWSWVRTAGTEKCAEAFQTDHHFMITY